MKRFTSVLFIVICAKVFSQGYDPLSPPNSYQSPDNPHYWKNRLPFEGYWQQDVHYKIKASVDEKTDIIDGSIELTYWNNSNDELTELFFHLYQNAFTPGSYYDDLQHHNNEKPVYGKYEKSGLGTVVENLKVNGKEAKTTLDNTILRVELQEAIKSGESASITMSFKTYFGDGSVRRRMKLFRSWGYKHYDGVHWYPRISVYDRKFGWTTDQHLGHEFYGDFGTYDVELTFASNFVMDATGFLLNRDEVLPPDLRQKLDIKNFKDKPWNSPPDIIIPYDSTKRKTWKFHAENVHDFAFTADPTYRIGEAEWNGIKCYALAQEPHASGWQNAAEYTAKIIQVYSEDIGMYVYHKMIVADARDGMEYPMLTLDGGRDPGYRGLLAHEVGHNWFFGQVGNNETYRAALDEGFTQFLTVWSLEKIEGTEGKQSESGSSYKKRFTKPEMVRNSNIYYRYLQSAVKNEEITLNTHSDDFNGALRHGGGYGQVYNKTAAMLYNLQYVLGDELFLKSMQNYFNQWKICHPYFEDFRNSIIHYTKVDLNWFFDQWLETSKTIDYGIKSVKKGKEKGEYVITFKRNGKMQMPLDFTVFTKDEKNYSFHIPNTWFVKKTDAVVLPKWHGWDKLSPEYKATVKIPAKLHNVVIDTTKRLADTWMPDNTKRGWYSFNFDSRIFNLPDWQKYELFGRPDIWYNTYDGLKAGFHLNGNYMNYRHIFNASVWFNTGLMQGRLDSLVDINRFDDISFLFNYQTAFDRFSKNSTVFMSARALDGLTAISFGYRKRDNSDDNEFYVFYKSMIRPDTRDSTYLLYPEQWVPGKFNNTINVGIKHHYEYQAGTGDIGLNLKSSTLGSDYDYSFITLTAINKNKLGKFRLNTRTFMQFGTGSAIAGESALYQAGANPEEMMDNKYTRSRVFFPQQWMGYGDNTNHFHYGGGLNLRGYAGYLIPNVANGETRYAYNGNTGAALNVELEFNRFARFDYNLRRKTFKLTPYLFGDAGAININTETENLAFTDIRVDAGIGAALTIQKWGPIEMVNPLTIRFDMPLFLNRTPAVSPDFFQFRWVLAINRAF